MANVNRHFHTTNTWVDKLDFFIPFMSQQVNDLESIHLKIPTFIENNINITARTVSIWQDWKSDNKQLVAKVQGLFLKLNEEYEGNEIPLEELNKMMSEWQQDPILLTNVARDLEKNNKSLFEELQNQGLIIYIKLGHEGEHKLYSKALLERVTPYLKRLMDSQLSEYDQKTETILLPEDIFFSYMLIDLEYSLKEENSTSNEVKRVDAFIDSFVFFDDLIEIVIEYELISVKNHLIKLIGDHLIFSQNKDFKFFKNINDSIIFKTNLEDDLKKRIETLYAVTDFLKNSSLIDLSTFTIKINTQDELDLIAIEVEKLRLIGYLIDFNLFIENNADLKSITIPQTLHIKHFKIEHCINLRKIHGTAEKWELYRLESLENIEVAHALIVKIHFCYRLKNIQGNADIWSIADLCSLEDINFGLAKEIYIASCSRIKSIRAIAEKWDLHYLDDLVDINIGKSINAVIRNCKKLESIDGQSKNWLLSDLHSLKIFRVTGLSEKVRILNCNSLETILGSVKKLDLYSLQALKTVNISLSKEIIIDKCVNLYNILASAEKWVLIYLPALKELNIGQSEEVEIKFCSNIETIQGVAKTWYLCDLESLKSFSMNGSI